MPSSSPACAMSGRPRRLESGGSTRRHRSRARQRLSQRADAVASGHSTLRKIRRRLYQILEQGPVGDRASWLVGRLLVALIVINLVAMTLESVPSLEAGYSVLFGLIEICS